MILTDGESRDFLRARDLRVASANPSGSGGSLKLAAWLDRDKRCHVIEATNGAGGVLRQSVDSFIGLSPFVARRFTRHWQLREAARPVVEHLIEALCAILRADCVRVVLDELAIDEGVSVCIGSASIELDRTAAFRHPEWQLYGERLPGTAIEQAFRRVGAIAAEIEPNGTIVAVVSGAGIMMTVLDMLTAKAASVRCVVDMQGLPLQGERGMRPIVENAVAMGPRVTFIGGRFQAPVAHLFAETVIAVHRSTPLAGRVVTWIAGNMAEEALALFGAQGFETHGDMRAALASVASAAR